MDWEIWGPPSVVLGLSLAAAAVVIWRASGEDNVIDHRAELEAQKAQLLEALRELEADRSKMEEAEYQHQHRQQLDKAAVVAQALATYEHPSEQVQRVTVPSKVSVGGLLGSFTGTLLFFLLLGYLLSEYARPRGEGEVMTGGSMTSSSSASQEVTLARQARVEGAQKILDADQSNIDALNVLTYDALLYRQMQAAMGYMENVRGSNPDDPDLLVHLAILQMSVGMIERADQSIARALVKKPGMVKAKLWQAFMLAQLGQKEAALAAAKAIRDQLELEEERYLLAQLMGDLQKAPPILQGTVRADFEQSAKYLFVIARRSEEGGGPPVAVKKITNPVFPMSFALGKDDMVMGGNWPEKVWLEARLDADGNATTKSPEDLSSAQLGPLTGLQEQLVLVLGAEQLVDQSTKTESEKPGPQLSGSITAPGAPSGMTLFIIARRALQGGGPPVAVKKVVSPTFPLAFSLSDSDMMMGGVWPEKVWLEARLDTDGNAMTKDASDWSSQRIGPLTSGSNEGILVLEN